MVEVPLWLAVLGGIFTIFCGGGGLIAAVLSIRKSTPEIAHITADTAHIVQAGVMEANTQLIENLRSVLAIAKTQREESAFLQLQLEKDLEDCMKRAENKTKAIETIIKA